MVDPIAIASAAKAREKADRKLLDTLRKRNPRQVDKVFHQAHAEVFACTDCLQCANCCRTAGPRLTPRDIARIAKHLRLSQQQFTARYLRKDEDGDMVMNTLPCPFLGDDNLCSIYDQRPNACREYPHTDREKQAQLFKLTLRNAAICPAVPRILDRVGELM